MRKILILFIILILSNCGSKKSYDSTLTIEIEEVVLNENLVLISPPRSFSVLQDDSFVVVTENFQIVRYSADGQQIQVIENIGQGELEIYAPRLVKSFKNGFLIWCSDLLKMVEYDANGIPIDEYFGFDHAIRKFEVDEDRIYTYISSTTGKPFIQIYNKTSRSIEKLLGYSENEQVLKNLNGCAGGLATNGSSLVFSPSHALNIYQIKKPNFEKTKVTLLDENYFQNIEIYEDAVNLINTNQSKAIDLSLAKGLVTGLFYLNNQILITGEVGEFTKDHLSLNTKNRKLFMLLLDENLNKKGIFFENYDALQSCRLFASDKGQFTRILQKERDSEMEYVLQKLKF